MVNATCYVNVGMPLCRIFYQSDDHLLQDIVIHAKEENGITRLGKCKKIYFEYKLFIFINYFLCFVFFIRYVKLFLPLGLFFINVVFFLLVP